MRDKALDGRHPRPGTKAHLHLQLLAAGWDPDTLRKQDLELTRTRLFDLPTETKKKPDPKIDSLVTDLRKKGVAVDPVERPKEKGPTQWTQDTWDSLCLHPWWVSSGGGQRSLFLISHTAERAELATSLFIHDMWESLREAPEERMPVFRRMSLVALMSPETLNQFMATTGATTDLLVVHGGFLDADTMYQNFAHLAAVRSLFEGFIIYEAVVPHGDDPARVGDAARRAGFPTVLGVG